jgi:hypothetical protein
MPRQSPTPECSVTISLNPTRSPSRGGEAESIEEVRPRGWFQNKSMEKQTGFRAKDQVGRVASASEGESDGNRRRSAWVLSPADGRDFQQFLREAKTVEGADAVREAHSVSS